MQNDTLKPLLANRRPEFWEKMVARTRQTADCRLTLPTFCASRRESPRPARFRSTVSSRKRSAWRSLEATAFTRLHESPPGAIWLIPRECRVNSGLAITTITLPIKHEPATAGFCLLSSQVSGGSPAAGASLRKTYSGQLSDPRETAQAEADGVVHSLIELAGKIHAKTRAEVIVTNFILPARHDLGAYRSRTLGP